MKGLSIEEKAKRYDEALEKARKLYAYPTTKPFISDLQDMFSELKESEAEKDARISKRLIECLKGNMPDNEYRREYISWLEKQGEQKYNNTDFSDLRTWKYIVDAVLTEKEGIGQYLDSPVTEEVAKKLQKRFGNIEQMPVDKVEPKFKTGQWIVWQDKCYKVNYNSCGYELVDQNGLSTSLEYGIVDENAHFWNITKDAKDGDVLCTHECSVPKIVFILKGTPKKYYALSYYCSHNIMHPYFNVKYGREAGCLAPDEKDVKPATKEQCNLLFQRMKEAGYEWDKDTKVLNKVTIYE